MSLAHPIASPKPEDWLTRKQAAAYLSEIGCPIAPQTLANMACKDNAGKGPPFTRIRWAIVRYHKTDLQEWAIRESVRIT